MSGTSITLDLPPRLAEQVQKYVQAGWSRESNTLVVEALRRYIETHQTELVERFIEQDIEWRLRAPGGGGMKIFGGECLNMRNT